MNEKATPPVTIQQKITQNGCGAGCGKGCLILAALIIGFLAFATHSCTSNFRQLREKSTTTTSVTLDQPPPKTEAEVATTKEQLPNAATEKITAADPLAEPEPIIAEMMFRKSLRDYLNDPNSYTPGLLRHAAHPQGYAFIQEFRAKNAFGAMIKQSAGLLASTNSGTIAWTFYTPEQTPALIREILRFKAETDHQIKAFKDSVDEAKRDLSANPVRDDPAVVEARKEKAARAYSKPLPDIREEIAKRTREHAQNKLNPKRLTLLNLERRTHKLGTVWIQRFIADGKKWRTGFLESGGILSQIAPKTLQTYIDESTPEP